MLFPTRRRRLIPAPTAGRITSSSSPSGLTESISNGSFDDSASWMMKTILEWRHCLKNGSDVSPKSKLASCRPRLSESERPGVCCPRNPDPRVSWSIASEPSGDQLFCAVSIPDGAEMVEVSSPDSRRTWTIISSRSTKTREASEIGSRIGIESGSMRLAGSAFSSRAAGLRSRRILWRTWSLSREGSISFLASCSASGCPTFLSRVPPQLNPNRSAIAAISASLSGCSAPSERAKSPSDRSESSDISSLASCVVS